VKDDDKLLMIWLFTEAVWDFVVIGTLAWVVFWKGHSGWWFLLTEIVCNHTSLYKALRKRFGIGKNEDVARTGNGARDHG
jgi:hypothetical protein